MTLRADIENLLLYDPDRSRTTVHVWIAKPGQAELQALGQVFIITVIDQPHRLNHEIITVLQEEFQRHYYQSTDMVVERAFEAALQHTNHRLHQLILEGVNQWIDHAHLLIGVLRHQHLVVTSVGQVVAYLLRHERMYPILDQQASAKPNPLRIFSNLVSGQVENGDRLLFCSPSVLDYFSVEKMRRLLLDHAPAETVRNLENTLLGVGGETSFAALVIELTAEAEPAPKNSLAVGWKSPSRTAPQMSMEELITRERTTEQLLAPSVWPAVRDISRRTWLAFSQLVRTVIFRQPPRRIVPTTLSSPVQPTPSSETDQSRQNELWRSTQAIKAHAVALVRQWRPRSPLRSVSTTPKFPAVHTGWRQRLAGLVVWGQRLPRLQQLLLVAAVGLIIVLSTTLAHGSRPSPTARGDQITTVVNDIQNNLDQARAALLYGGENTARQKVIEIEKLLTTLPNRSKADQTRRAPLVADLAGLQQQLAHQTVVTNPTTLVNLAPTVPTVSPTQIYLLRDHLALYDPTTSTLVSTSLEPGATPNVINNTLDTGAPQTGAVSGTSTVMFVTDRDGFVEVDVVKNTWKPYDASWPKQNPQAQSLSVFQNRLYILNTSHNDLLRFTRGGASLGAGVSWLKEPATFNSARAAVVDGSIYVLQPKSVVEQYFSGRRSDWQLQPATPVAVDITRLWTDASSDYLYLLEPGQKRFLVYDKDGSFLDQYTSDSWTDLRDVVADEAGKMAYVLNGTSVYQVGLIR